MRDVSIIGIGQTEIGEHWHISVRDLGSRAIIAALKDAGIGRPDALYVGNMLSGPLARQEHLGPLLADWSGLRGIEALKVEAACAAGAAALRVGYMAVSSGLTNIAVVCGIEKMTDMWGAELTQALATAADAEYEQIHGLSFIAANALLMQRYLHEYGVHHDDFAGFVVNAHKNAVGNPHAQFRREIGFEDFKRARMIADPINMLDSAPVGDGASAVVLCASEQAKGFASKPVKIRASAVATDTVALHDRHDPLFLSAAYASAMKCYRDANVGPRDIDLFELHDAFTIISALSLEACGFAARGQGVRLAMEGAIAPEGPIPISTMGGLKARGHPVGATGVYQVVEVVQQLRGEAGTCQIPDARLGMTQNIGGSGATAITHILEGPP